MIQGYDKRKLALVAQEFTRFLIGDPNLALTRLKTIGNPDVRVNPEGGDSEEYNALFDRLPSRLLQTVLREFD